MTNADRLNAAIRERCAALGYTFKPWQPTPWEVDGPGPPAWAGTGAWSSEWFRVWRLRERLIAEISEGS
jgi:hypothetical protein